MLVLGIKYFHSCFYLPESRCSESKAVMSEDGASDFNLKIVDILVMRL